MQAGITHKSSTLAQHSRPSTRCQRPPVAGRRPCCVPRHIQLVLQRTGMEGARSVRLCASGASNAAVAPADAQKQTVYVPVAELQDLCHRALRTLGYQEDDISALTDVMMYAQLRDNNQGVIKITTGGMNRSPAAGAITMDKETRWSAVLNGNGQAGMLVLSQAMRLAIDKAKQHGFGIVGTNHTSTSTGALGYYAEQVAREGFIGVVFAQSPEFVAPHGAKQAVFGTNPIAIAIPAQQGPVVMDMATAAYAWFGLLEAKTAGRAIPGDVALDAQGRPTTDPSEVLSGGAIRVFDRSHKGSNLSLMVELLAGPLVGAAITDKLGAKNWGNLLLALDPELLGDRETIKQRVQVVLDRVKGAERLPGVDEILLPGERGNRLASQRLASGMLPIESNLYNNLRVMASKDTIGPSSSGSTASMPTASSSSSSSGERPQQQWGMATRLLHPEQGSVQDPYHASGPPLYQTATYAQPSATDFGPYDYTRSGNPTRTMFEEQWAALEGAHKAFAFTSGMAALAVAVKLVTAGGHIVAGDDIYGGTSRLLSQVVPAAGVSVSNVDMTDLSAVRAAIIPGKTQLVMIESPTNPRMQICDIAAIARIAHEAGALVCVDNSFMTPLVQRPLDLGADISMTSGTKYIGGHGDITLGMLAVNGEELAKRVYFLQNAEGAGLAPLDCWLAARGLKTMALRLERSQENAVKIAAFLAQHPLVKKLNYAAYDKHPGAPLHAQQATGGGAVLSFETGDVEVSKIIVNESKLFKVTVSFGNVVSLISLPCYMSHASIPPEVRAARGLPDDLVRISAGIENAEDLIADLSQAMDLAAQHLARKQAASSTLSSSSNGNGSSRHGSSSSAAAAAAGREAELLERVRALEEQLQGIKGLMSLGSVNGKAPASHT